MRGFLKYGCAALALVMLLLVQGCATGVKSRDIYAKSSEAHVLQRVQTKKVDSLEVSLKYKLSTKGEHLFLLQIENNRLEPVHFTADSCWIMPFALSKPGRKQSVSAKVALNAEEFVDEMERRYQRDKTKAQIGGGILIAGAVITSIALMGNSGLDASDWIMRGSDLVDLTATSAIILNEVMQEQSELRSAQGTEREIRAAEGLLFDHGVEPGTTLEGPVALPRIKAKWFVVTIWLGGSEFSFAFEEK